MLRIHLNKRVTIWCKISHGDVAEDSSLQGCDTVPLVISRRFDGPYFPHVNPLNAELNPICHLLALLGGATIVVVSRLRVKGQALQDG